MVTGIYKSQFTIHQGGHHKWGGRTPAGLMLIIRLGLLLVRGVLPHGIVVQDLVLQGAFILYVKKS